VQGAGFSAGLEKMEDWKGRSPITVREGNRGFGKGAEPPSFGSEGLIRAGKAPLFEPAQALSHGVSHRKSSKLKILSPTPLTRLGHPCTNKF